MRFARCISVTTENNIDYYTLKYDNGHIDKLGGRYILDNIVRDSIRILNIKINEQRKLEVYKNLSSLENYEDLRVNIYDEKSHNTYIKSRILGICPADDSGVLYSRVYNNIVITDESNILKDNVRAKKVTFVGGNPLRVSADYFRMGRPSIVCAKAIIMNPCLMASILPGPYCNGVAIKSSNIEIKHDFIDIFTVYELYDLLDYTYRVGDSYSIQNLKVDFKTCSVNFKDIEKIAIDTTYNNLDNMDKLSDKEKRALMLTNMHWLCVLYESTEYSLDYLLELAEMCSIVLRDGFGDTSSDYYFLKMLHSKLLGGYKG